MWKAILQCSNKTLQWFQYSVCCYTNKESLWNFCEHRDYIFYNFLISISYATSKKSFKLKKIKVKKIAIVQRVVTDYRVNFFNTLNDLLDNENIELTVYAGNGRNSEKFKNGLEEIKCARRVKNYYILNTRFYFQNICSILNQYDIVNRASQYCDIKLPTSISRHF